MFLFLIFLSVPLMCLSGGMIITEQSQLLPGNHSLFITSFSLLSAVEQAAHHKVSDFYQKFEQLKDHDKWDILSHTPFENLFDANEKEISKERRYRCRLLGKQFIFAFAYIAASNVAHGALCYSQPDTNIDTCSTLYGNSIGSFGLLPACFLTYLVPSPSESIKTILKKLESEKKELQKNGEV